MMYMKLLKCTRKQFNFCLLMSIIYFTILIASTPLSLMLNPFALLFAFTFLQLLYITGFMKYNELLCCFIMIWLTSIGGQIKCSWTVSLLLVWNTILSSMGHCNNHGENLHSHPSIFLWTTQYKLFVGQTILVQHTTKAYKSSAVPLMLK